MARLNGAGASDRSLGRSIGELLRVSLSWSAAADVAAGVVFAAGGWPGGAAPWIAIAASLAAYHGGMALNDWSDRVVDASARPGRPIPSGRVTPGLALGVALGLLFAAPLVALAAPGPLVAPVGGIVLLAAAYDLVARGPWIGPLTLAACRALNLTAGLVVGTAASGVAFDPLALGAPLFYGLYVFFVSRLGRLEDGADPHPLGRRPARLVATLAALLLALPILPLPGGVPPPSSRIGELLAGEGLRIPLATLVAAAGAFGLLRLAFRDQEWTRARVMEAMGMALRRLLVFTATLGVMRGTPGGLLVGAAILSGYPVSHALRRAFPPS